MNEPPQRPNASAPSGSNPDQSTLRAVAATEHPSCFLCNPKNERGLGLRFRVQPDGSVAALFACKEVFQSYPETLHGGVISALFDAAMTNMLFAVNVVGVTAELSVRYLAPVRLERGAVVRASIEKDLHPLYYLEASLEQDRAVLAHASAKFLVKGLF